MRIMGSGGFDDAAYYFERRPLTYHDWLFLQSTAKTISNMQEIELKVSQQNPAYKVEYDQRRKDPEFEIEYAKPPNPALRTGGAIPALFD